MQHCYFSNLKQNCNIMQHCRLCDCTSSIAKLCHPISLVILVIWSIIIISCSTVDLQYIATSNSVNLRHLMQHCYLSNLKQNCNMMQHCRLSYLTQWLPLLSYRQYCYLSHPKQNCTIMQHRRLSYLKQWLPLLSHAALFIYSSQAEL